MNKLIMVFALFVMALATTSCNMLRGAGRDIESVGDSISRAGH